MFRAGAFGIFVLGAGGAHTADLGAVCIISTPTRESDMLTNTANDRTQRTRAKQRVHITLAHDTLSTTHMTARNTHRVRTRRQRPPLKPLLLHRRHSTAFHLPAQMRITKTLLRQFFFMRM